MISIPQIYADLPGYLSSTDSTIPSHILPTSQRPDLVLLFPNRKIYIIELTIPFESNLDNAHTRKHDRYASLISDLRFSSYHTRFFSLEVGSRGFLSDSNYSVLKSILPAQCSVSPRYVSDLTSHDSLLSAPILSFTLALNCLGPLLPSSPSLTPLSLQNVLMTRPIRVHHFFMHALC